MKRPKTNNFWLYRTLSYFHCPEDYYFYSSTIFTWSINDLVSFVQGNDSDLLVSFRPYQFCTTWFPVFFYTFLFLFTFKVRLFLESESFFRHHVLRAHVMHLLLIVLYLCIGPLCSTILSVTNDHFIGRWLIFVQERSRFDVYSFVHLRWITLCAVFSLLFGNRKVVELF